MKKAIKIILIVIGAIVLLNVLFFIFRICPPQGPWPTPPRCTIGTEVHEPKVGYIDDLGCFPEDCTALPPGMKELCEDFSKGTINRPPECNEMRDKNCQKLCEREKKEAKMIAEMGIPFEPKELNYITDTFSPTDKKLIFGIGMHDIRGNTCYAADLRKGCENSLKHISSSFNRAKSIGSTLLLVTDFSVLKKDLSMRRPHPMAGAHEISEAELKTMVSTAKKYGQQMMLITNLYDGEDDARNAIDYQRASDETIKALFSGRKAIISENAGKAENAGVDYFIINARDIQLDYFDSKRPLLNTEYAEITKAIKEKYHGKLCYRGNIGMLTDQRMTFLDDIDCVIEDRGISNIMKNAKEDVNSLENARGTYLSQSDFGKLADKEVFIMALVPSYDGAIRQGRIEPGIGYASGQYTRDRKEQALVYEALFRAIYQNKAKHIDGIIAYGYRWTDTIHPDDKMANGLGHSIRGKDAEQVFYKRSKIFNQQ